MLSQKIAAHIPQFKFTDHEILSVQECVTRELNNL